MLRELTHKSEKGITYVEVIICVIIMGFVVGPLAFSFVTASNTRVNAERVDTATEYAESIMALVQNRMTQDIEDYQRVQGNRVKNTLIGAGKAIDIDQINKYIERSETASDDTIDDLQKFLGMNVAEYAAFQKKYETGKYTYQIAIWNMQNIDSTEILSEDGFKINKANLQKAYKASGNTNADFYYKNLDSPSLPVSFKLAGDASAKAKLQKAFQSVDGRYLLDGTSYKTIDIFHMAQDNAGALTFTESANVAADCKEIKVDSAVKGFQITLSPKAGGTLKDVIIVNWNVLKAIRDSNMGPLDNYKNYTYHFINKTGKDVFINMIASELTDEDLALNSLTAAAKVSRKEIFNGFHVISEEDGNAQTKTTIGSSEPALDSKGTYVIALFIKEKKPVGGEEGKIIKKMFDIYSYDDMTNERWSS